MKQKLGSVWRKAANYGAAIGQMISSVQVSIRIRQWVKCRVMVSVLKKRKCKQLFQKLGILIVAKISKDVSHGVFYFAGENVNYKTV